MVDVSRQSESCLGGTEDHAPVSVAAAQFDAAPREVARNTKLALDAVREAGRLGARLVVLPEGCLGGYDLGWLREGLPGGGNALHGESLEQLRHVGDELGLVVVVNDLEHHAGKIFSTSVILSEGREAVRYRKTHVTLTEERAGMGAGDELAPVVSLPGLPLQVAPLICFEHGFPEIALTLALGGAGLLVMSSAIREGYEYLRELRTRARAQDNGVYAIAANLVGHGYCGGSLIIDPRGDVIARGSATDAEVIIAPIDPVLVRVQREAEPVLARRRVDLYGLTR